MIEITYLLNSGFLVRVGRTLLVFDDFKDPAGAVDAAVEAADFDHLYFFASHGHFDHFDAHICTYEAKTERYILSDDIRCTKALSSFDQAKLVFLKTYASWQDEHIAVESFDSTDIGTSFRVVLKDEGVTIFHAGDFNWWDWTGEPQEQRKLAENAFRKQMKKLKGLEADLAFFPVDGRLGPSIDKGAKVFCAETEVRALVTMHSVGYPAWQPPEGFFGAGRSIPVWSPRTPGEKACLKDGQFLAD